MGLKLEANWIASATEALGILAPVARHMLRQLQAAVRQVWAAAHRRVLQMLVTFGCSEGPGSKSLAADAPASASSGSHAPQGLVLWKAGADLSPLLDECWHCVLGFLDAQELSSCGLWGPKFAQLSSSDELWRKLCRQRWDGKQRVPVDELFWNGAYDHLRLSVPECQSLLARRGVSCEGLLERTELMLALSSSRAVGDPTRTQLLPCCGGKWKTSYVHAEVDSRRQIITLDEVAYFRWNLVYNGRPSSMGHRHFQRNGVFISPHFGQTEWRLDSQNRFAMEGVSPLKVERDVENWGWIFGRGTGIEYYSVEA